MSAPRRSPGEAGYTLAELLIASSLLGVFATVIAMASAFCGREMGQLRDRSRSAVEMRAVVEHLRRDLGAAERVDVLGQDRLRIRREAGAARLAGHAGNGTDPGIEYRLRDGRLQREDRGRGTTVIVSDALRRFTLDDAGGDIAITIDTGTEKAGHRVALQWLANP